MLADAGGKPEVILLGTGSEVSLCIEAYEKLTAEGVKARVVSMPSWEIFEQQDAVYKESVLPSDVTARVGGNGLYFWVGSLYRIEGAQRRHAPVWGLGTVEDELVTAKMLGSLVY